MVLPAELAFPSGFLSVVLQVFGSVQTGRLQMRKQCHKLPTFKWQFYHDGIFFVLWHCQKYSRLSLSQSLSVNGPVNGDVRELRMKWFHFQSTSVLFSSHINLLNQIFFIVRIGQFDEFDKSCDVWTRCNLKPAASTLVGQWSGENPISPVPTAREGNVFTGVCNSVHNRPHSYSVAAHPCNGAIGTHRTGRLFLLEFRKKSCISECTALEIFHKMNT